MRILSDEASSERQFEGTLNSAKPERVLSAVMAHKKSPRPQQSRLTTCSRSRSATKIAQRNNEHLSAALEGRNFAQIDDKSALDARIVNGRKHISVHVFVLDTSVTTRHCLDRSDPDTTMVLKQLPATP